MTVYCRVPHISYPGREYRSMRLVKLPTIRAKHVDTIAHSFLSSIHALFMRYDVALYFNVGNSPVSWVPRLGGQRVVLNVDGLDRERKKWGRFARWFIRSCEGWEARCAQRVVIDSGRVQQLLPGRARSAYIAYGAEPASVPPGPRRYVLFVGRLVPENCAHHLVGASDGLVTDNQAHGGHLWPPGLRGEPGSREPARRRRRPQPLRNQRLDEGRPP